ncbi:MAG: exosortase C-terminal domain/associated protein EpsI [Candidatus Omnitrophota bacterium]
MSNKNFIIVICVLALACAVGFLSYSSFGRSNSPEVQMASFPMTIGEWKGTDIPLRERDYEILETRNLIMRDYINQKTADKVNLYIIYSQDNRKAAHPPEICYTGGGANTITEKSVVPVTDSISANRFVIENKDFRQLVVYWFKSTDFSTYSYFRQQLKAAIDHMFRKKTSSAMIRISATLKDDDQSPAFNRIKAFCSEIEPLIKKYVP